MKPLLVLLALLGSSCAVRQRPMVEVPVDPVDDGDASSEGEADAAPKRLMSGIRFDVTPPDAEVTLDDRVLGPASTLGEVPLAPGIYRVSVKAQGFNTWRAEITVGEKVELLQISLVPR